MVGSSLQVELAADASVRALDPAATIEQATGAFRAEGTVDLVEQSAVGDVEIPILRTNLASIADQDFHVEYRDGVVEARKIHDRAPVDLFVRLDTDPLRLYASVLADAYAPSRLVTLEGAYADFNDYLAYPVSGQAAIIASTSEISFSGGLFTSLSDLDPLPDGDLTIRFSGTPEVVTLGELDYRSEYGTVVFTGEVPLTTLRPTGTVSLQGVTYGGIRPVWLTADVISTPSSLRVTTRNVYYSGTYIGFLDVRLGLAGTPTADVTATFDRAGRKRLDVSAQLSEDWRVLGGQATLANIQPAEVFALQDAFEQAIELPSVVDLIPQEVEIDAEATFDLRDGFAIDAPYVSVIDRSTPDNYASFSLRYSRAVIRIDDLFVGYDGYMGIGRFTANLVDDQSIEFEGDISVEQLSYQFSGRYIPGDRLELSGLHDIDATISFGDRGEVAFQIDGDLPLPIEGPQESSLAFDVAGFYAGITDWSVTINEIVASGLPYYTVDAATVAIQGSADPRGAELDRLAYTDQYSSLVGSGRLEWNIAELEWDISRLAISGSAELSASAGNESYHVTVTQGDRAIDLVADVVESPLERIGVELVSGSLTGSAHVRGPTDALSVNATGELIDGVFDDEPLELAGSIASSPRGARVADGRLAYLGTVVEDVAAAVSLDSLKASLSAVIRNRTNPRTEPVGLNGNVQFLDPAGSLEELFDARFDAAIIIDNVDTDDVLPERWEFTGTRVADAIDFTGGPQESVTGTIRLDGTFSLDVTRPIPIAFHADGRFVDGQIEADLIDLDADVPQLFAFTGTPDVYFDTATTSGSVRVTGSISDPDFYGTVDVRDITGRVTLVNGAIGPARTFLVFEEKTVRLRRTTAPVGAGSAVLSGEFTMNRWIPEEYRVLVDISEAQTIPIAYDVGGVYVDGRARGSVTIQGGPGFTDIRGRIIGSSATITLSEVPVNTDAEPSDTSVDLVVETGRGMEFMWPTSNFPILRGSAVPGETIRVTHNSRTGDLSVAGDVDIQGGEVFYFDRSFYVREGTITFDEDETEFDPVLSVRAEIREVGEEGPVRVSLVVDEDPLSLFTPRWESDPSMTETEILAMLGGNVFGAEPGEELDFEQVARLAGDAAGQFTVVQNFESTVREALQLDMFSLRTPVVGNVLVGAIQSARDPLDTSAPSLGQYLDNTTLFLGKYLGTDLFLELLVQLQADDPLSTTTQSLTGLSVESELSLEWQTPFFLLQWALAPNDPASLFLADNSVSFSWEYSY